MKFKVKLDSFDKTVKVAELCSKYACDFNIDAKYGRYTVDASSILGLEYLIGHTVEIVPIADENNFNYKRFIHEMEVLIDGTE